MGGILEMEEKEFRGKFFSRRKRQSTWYFNIILSESCFVYSSVKYIIAIIYVVYYDHCPLHCDFYYSFMF